MHTLRRSRGNGTSAHAPERRPAAGRVRVLPPPRLPGVGGACDVRAFNPETAAAAEATEPRGCCWWALPGFEREARNPEAEAGSRPSFGEWPLPGLGSRVGAWAARKEGASPFPGPWPHGRGAHSRLVVGARAPPPVGAQRPPTPPGSPRLPSATGFP